MSGRVVDLCAERRIRQRSEMHFRTDADALVFVAERLDDMRRQTGGQRLVPAADLGAPLAQAAAVIAECLRLHNAVAAAPIRTRHIEE